jgi:peptidoglycan/LPS O-acetylase OafA/YrhL
MISAMPFEHGRARAGRVTAVDGLRGTLAIIVLAWHVASPFGLRWMLVPANVAVDIFFLLSGYVLTRAWDGEIGAFLIRRFVRLWPVYALCLGVGYAIAGVRPVWSEFLWYPLMSANDGQAIDPPVWSLFLEVWTMPFMPLIVQARFFTPVRAALVVAGLAIAGQAIAQLHVLALFVLGAAVARHKFRNPVFESAVPQWLGKISYSLYLSHALVLKLAVLAAGPWGGVAAVPCAIGLGWLIWLTVERPAIWASRWVGRAASRGISASGERAPAV